MNHQARIPLLITQLLISLESLQVWTRNGVRGVWFEVEPAFSEWIPVLIQVNTFCSLGVIGNERISQTF